MYSALEASNDRDSRAEVELKEDGGKQISLELRSLVMRPTCTNINFGIDGETRSNRKVGK